MTEPQTLYERQTPLRRRPANSAFDRLLRAYYAFFIPPGVRILALGCGSGDLLAALKPSRGVGIDGDPELIARAQQKHPALEFHMATEPLAVQEKFDYIILPDLVNYLPDVQSVLERLQKHSYQHTRLVLNTFNHLWRPCVSAAQKLTGRSSTLPE